VGDHPSVRALNRATLARQLLLQREKLTPVQALTRLVGMQAQAQNPPYYGLWSRLERFTQQDLSDLVVGKQVVRMALMRSTIHLVTADDALMLKPVLQPVLDRGMQGAYGKQIAGVDRAELLATATRLVEAEPLTFKALGEALARHLGKGDPHALAMGARSWAALVQVPPRGLWGVGGQAAHTTAQMWLGRPLRKDVDRAVLLDEMFLRYLAGFGPATVKDVQMWSGLTRLGEVAERLRPRLVEKGGYLDLPDAPRPDAEVAAPVRYLADFENMLLSYADRTRILPEEHRKRLFSRPNGIVPGTFTVDGFVAGEWKITTTKQRAALELTPYTKLSKKDRVAVEKEGAALLSFAAPGLEQEIR
jgi:hypothetical protein